MSTEDLLRPRYKVIADYPGNDINVGFIFEPNVDWPESYLNTYPHLFDPLQWWEERDEKDIPKWVKTTKNGIDFYQWDKHNFSDDFLIYNGVIPATEYEYNEYLKQSKK